MASTNRISYLRKKRGFSMRKLASRVGTSQQQIDRLEKGKRRLTVEWMEKLSEALDCGIMDILPDTHKERDYTNTTKAKVIGAVNLYEDGKLEEFEEKEIYTVIFGRPKNITNPRLFALVTKGEGLGFGNKSELIMTEVDSKRTIEEGKIVLCAERSGQYYLRKTPVDKDKEIIKAILVKIIQDV